MINRDLQTTVTILTIFWKPMRENFALESARIWKTESGRVFPFVRSELHSPSVVNPRSIYKYKNFLHVRFKYIPATFIFRLTISVMILLASSRMLASLTPTYRIHRTGRA